MFIRRRLLNHQSAAACGADDLVVIDATWKVGGADAGGFALVEVLVEDELAGGVPELDC